MTEAGVSRLLYAVMGDPVSHSKSPAIHRQFGRQCEVALDYRAIAVQSGGLARAVREFRAAGGSGLNITVPLKREAYEIADRRSARAEQARAVNTLKFEADGTVYGDNTDGVGLVRDLGANLRISLVRRDILVLGAGGAARGIVGPLLEQHPARLQIANRTVGRAHELARDFGSYGTVDGCGFDALEGKSFDIVINATAASLHGEVPALPENLFRSGALAYDLMYGERPTAFMRWAQAQGVAHVSDGLGMLVEQAAESFFIWHGMRPQTAPVIDRLRGGEE
jgi:shikimate dehydrogenase